MPRAVLASIAVLCLSCGAEAPPPDTPNDPPVPANEGRAENGPPFIEALEIRPANPTASDALSVAVEAGDPDRDELTVEYEWFVNGQSFGAVEMIEPGELSRQDRVYAVVTVTDGIDEVSERTEAVNVSNASPQITAIRVTPAEATATDMLVVEVEAVDADDDPISYEYRWSVNGALIDDAQNSRLEPRRATRGDKVTVQVAASDGWERGEWATSQTHHIGNAPPEITTQPVYELASSGTYRYEVKGQDPDGDRPLRYELVSGPPGMDVEIVSGIVTWQVPTDATGTYDVELSVSDPYGARTVQRYSLDVNWQEVPAESSPPGIPAAAGPGEGTAEAADADDPSQDAATESEIDDFVETPEADDAFETETPEAEDDLEEPAGSDFEDDFEDSDDF